MNLLVEVRVLRGIEWLDDNAPIKDWHKKIDTVKLDLELQKYCILGQIYGFFQKGVFELKSEPSELGFIAPSDMTDDEIEAYYEILNRTWLSCINTLIRN